MRDEMPSNTVEGANEILFPIVAIKCGVRLSLTSFVRQFLNELPLHPFQASLALWENLLALCMIWHKTHGREPKIAEL